MIKSLASIKNIKEASNCYTYALSHIDIAIEGAKEQQEQQEELFIFKSILYSNRAQSSLLLRNYRECIGDSDKALEYNPNNTKARYRKAKSLYQIKKYHLCRDECGMYMHVYMCMSI